MAREGAHSQGTVCSGQDSTANLGFEACAWSPCTSLLHPSLHRAGHSDKIQDLPLFRWRCSYISQTAGFAGARPASLLGPGSSWPSLLSSMHVFSASGNTHPHPGRYANPRTPITHPAQGWEGEGRQNHCLLQSPGHCPGQFCPSIGRGVESSG